MLLGWLLAPRGSEPLEYQAVCVVALWPPRNLSAAQAACGSPHQVEPGEPFKRYSGHTGPGVPRRGHHTGDLIRVTY